MPECDVTHCPEPGVQRIQHPRAPLEVRWLCRAHLAGWLEVNPATPIAPATRWRLAHQHELQRIVPNPAPAISADDTPLPMTEPDMSFPTETDLITLKAIMEAAGQKTRGELADDLDITLPAFKSRMYRLQSDGAIMDGEDGLKWDYVIVTDKGAQALAEAEAQAELDAEEPVVEADPAPARSAKPIQGQVTEDDVILDDPVELADVLAASEDKALEDCEGDESDLVESLSTRVHNQAQVIAALRRDLAAAKAVTVDQAVLDELEELRRRSAETSDALEGVDGDPTTAQSRAVLKACRERDEAVAEVGRLTRAVARCEREVALYRQVRDVLSGRTLPDLAEGTVPAQVKALVQRVAELRDAEERAWERGRKVGQTDVLDKLRWWLDPGDVQNYTGEGLLEQVRLLKVAANTITPYVLEAEEDAIYLRAGHPRFGLRIMLASWDEVGAQGGYVHLYDWDGPSHHSVPVDCPEIGKAVALGLLAARGIEVPEALFTASKEAEASGGDEKVACA